MALPRGLGLNPSSAPDLHFCSDGQFGKGTKAPVACPADSQIGTAAIQTPVLPANSLPARVFLGQQLSRDPASGQEYRIFVDAESPRYGLSVRLIGNVAANPQTGQLTATFADNPQVASHSFRVQLNGGAKAPLTSPPICANTTTTQISPWSGNPPAAPTSPLNLSKAPGGGACAKTMAERPFAPGFKAGPKSLNALDFTSFLANITRGDGRAGAERRRRHPAARGHRQAGRCPLLPAVGTGRRRGPGRRGRKAKSSCPADSQIGIATIAAGSGSSPLSIGGKAFLAGPYKGAPLSLAVVTPGCRRALRPRHRGRPGCRSSSTPESAQIHVVSDAIPDVFGGAKLDIRSIAVNVNKAGFALNGTNCSKFAHRWRAQGWGRRSDQPGDLLLLPGLRPGPAQQLRSARLPPRS